MGPTGEISEVGLNSEKSAKSKFFGFIALQESESVPITIIWDAEKDYVVKNTLTGAFGGPIGKTQAK